MKKAIKNINKETKNTGPNKIDNEKASKTIKNLHDNKYQYKGHFPDRTWAKPKDNKKGPKV